MIAGIGIRGGKFSYRGKGGGGQNESTTQNGRRGRWAGEVSPGAAHTEDTVINERLLGSGGRAEAFGEGLPKRRWKEFGKKSLSAIQKKRKVSHGGEY